MAVKIFIKRIVPQDKARADDSAFQANESICYDTIRVYYR